MPDVMDALELLFSLGNGHVQYCQQLLPKASHLTQTEKPLHCTLVAVRYLVHVYCMLWFGVDAANVHVVLIDSKVGRVIMYISGRFVAEARACRLSPGWQARVSLP